METTFIATETATPVVAQATTQAATVNTPFMANSNVDNDLSEKMQEFNERLRLMQEIRQKPIKFMNDAHKNFYESNLKRVEDNGKSIDSYEKALFYTLGIILSDENSPQNLINLLYDFKDNCIIIDWEEDKYGWITGTDIRIIRLAFNLYNGGYPTAFNIENQEKKLRETELYSVSDIFAYLDPILREYAFEAIRIRFNS